MTRLNTLVKNVTVVRPETGADGGEQLDIGITDGTFSRLEPNIPAEDADVVVDGRGLLAFPGVVDGHQHWGIYNSLEDDTDTESRASAQGGVTTGLTYMRTGQYYLNTGGPYREFFPKVLAASEGRSFIDYAFHLAPMSREHIDEIPSIITDLGVTSFKIFMFYGSHGLHGASSDQSAFLMIPPDERYDVAHFEFVMRGIQKARAEHPELADQISLSLHCETAEIMTAYTKMVAGRGVAVGAGGLQRLAPAALGGARRDDRVVPRGRDGAAEHQPAAPVVGQGADGGDADAGGLPPRELPARGHHRPPARRHHDGARPGRQGQPATAAA